MDNNERYIGVDVGKYFLVSGYFLYSDNIHYSGKNICNR